MNYLLLPQVSDCQYRRSSGGLLVGSDSGANPQKGVHLLERSLSVSILPSNRTLRMAI